MSKFFLYADPHSQAILAEDSEKLLLIGSDFGYGNFGDVLQHANALDFAKKNKRYRTVSVFNTEVISSPEFPAWARSNYQTDAIIFVSGVPHVFRDAVPAIDPVQTIRGLSFMWMYGGGFLNAIWGEHVLGVAEYFLERFPSIAYCISGQQITPPFQSRVCEHAKRYKPKLLGVRDDASFHAMTEAGYQPNFSFDDASEALQVLGGEILRHSDSGALAHINLSDYTANDADSHSMAQELFELKSNLPPGVELTFLQAFRDRRENVRDTREAIKLLEAGFPFADYRFVELSAFCYPGSKIALDRFVSGAFGYSCSYHVALWLQLAGIPCFLRSRNAFYDQKAIALGVTQSFNEFLESPQLTDHSSNLGRREEWLVRLGNVLDHAPEIKSEFKFDWSNEKDQAWLYYFKGTPTLEEKLKWWTKHATDLANENTELHGRVDGLSVQLTEVGDEAHRQRERAEVAERDLGEARSENAELHGRVEALSTQISLILASRSWRLTRGLRVIGRLFRGEFGAVFAALRQRYTRHRS